VPDKSYSSGQRFRPGMAVAGSKETGSLSLLEFFLLEILGKNIRFTFELADPQDENHPRRSGLDRWVPRVTKLTKFLLAVDDPAGSRLPATPPKT